MNARREPSRERGALAVELALMLVFFLMPLVIGVLDFGQVLHAQIVVTRAARQGALAAARSEDVQASVDQYIRDAGYDPARLQVASADSGDGTGAVTVTVRYDTAAMTILPLGDLSDRLGQVVGTATTQHY